MLEVRSGRSQLASGGGQVRGEPPEASEHGHGGTSITFTIMKTEFLLLNYLTHMLETCERF